jgi:FlaA1/EpsC-like NDP-sugar epimerase
MGLEVRDEAHPYGDISIQYVGPRDGEKLYEELLIGENVIPTEHTRIMRSQEPFLPQTDLDAVLSELTAAMEKDSVTAIQATLARAVENYRPARRDADGGKPREAA